MKKIIMSLCLIALTTGIASARPMQGPQPGHHHQQPPMMERRMPQPAPMPVVVQPPVVYQNAGYGYSSPSVTFSNKYFDLSVGL